MQRLARDERASDGEDVASVGVGGYIAGMPVTVAVSSEIEGEDPKALGQRLGNRGPFLGVAGEPVEEQDRVSRPSEPSHGQDHVAVVYLEPARGVTHRHERLTTPDGRGSRRVLNGRLAPASG